ncbi:MAG: prolipoprotein diacylglyceryl transferase [Bacteroidales bacterium]|nr:prolipoprotein diacylglyceryl transferase [Bacteroidales bacterium]
MVPATFIWNGDPVMFRFMGVAVRYYSLCWVVGFILGYLVVRKVFIRESLDLSLLDKLLMYVLVGTLVGLFFLFRGFHRKSAP